MSATIDQRVVEMRFDNRQFESNVSNTMSTLDKLKQRLNLTGATKGLENIESAARGVNMSGLGSAVDTIQAKFSALSVVGMTALANITNSAVNAGKRIVSALTIDPIKTGFAEYETQINAVQTILANTKSKGTTIDDVNGALDELNTYADKTIYNFTEMTRNIGTFTAAGVDLDKSVTSIKGIANLAAVSGSTSQQASTAMYQLSQALAAGKVQLMDWNSVVNAGMGGQVFQDALKRTATHLGTNVDAMIEKYGSFRESLTKGEWLTAEVLTETLTQLSGAYTEADLIAQGYTEAQAKEITELADTAVQAATKVKTFTQLWDTLKEAAQSGWTQSWEIIVGDFEEAKEMLTQVSDTIGAMIGASSDSRNKLLQGWKDAGGRDDLLEGFKNAFEGVMNVIKPVKAAFRDIFPPLTVKNLLSFTEGFKTLTSKFKEFGTKYADQIQRTFKGLFSIIDIGKKVFTAFVDSVSKLVGSSGVSKVGDFLMNTAASIGDFFTSLNEGFDVRGVSDIFSSIASGISSALGTTVDVLKGFGSALTIIGDVICNVASSIWSGVKTVFGWISENLSVGDIFAGLAGGGIFLFAKKLIKFVDGIKEAFDGLFEKGKSEGLMSKIGDVFESLGESLQAFTASIKVWSLVGIAAAIGILSASLRTISELDAPEIAKSLFTIGSLLAMLSLTFTSMMKTLAKFDSKGIVKSSFALILVAAALNILANVVEKFGEMSLGEIGKGLLGVGGGLAELAIGLKIIGSTKISLSTSIAMLALAESCNILGDAMKKFSGLSWGEIGRGLAGMGGALGELVIALGVLSKVGGGGSLLGSASILIAVQSLSKMADGLEKFGAMAWDEIGRGLAAMGGALAELGIVLGGLGKFAGFSSIFASGAILVVTQGLDDLANALVKFGIMPWGEIGRGLAGMGGALAELGIVLSGVGKIAGFSSLVASGAILIAVQGLDDLANALKKFGEMSWSEIGRGLSAMGGALGELGIVLGGLGKFAGLSSIFGSGAILIVIQGLDDLANALTKFGKMSWSEIGRGLAAMGGALLEVGGISGALGYLTNFAGLLGSGSLWIAIQGLNDLADAFKKFGEMSWDEIGRGLAAMGSAMGEVALGGILNTLSGLGSMSIAKVAEPLGILADSVKKWVGVEVPKGLGLQISALAAGVQAFTFGGLGASAIADVAEPLGVLASSVMKWNGVSVPEGLGDQLASLADGVGTFTFGGLGASAIAEVAIPLGNLATSVSKWSSVTVPEDLGEKLTSLADGVKSFTWAFMGGWSMDTVVEPLSALPDAIAKWNGVKMPDNLGTQLTTLADGIKAFSWAFMGGLSLDTVVEPLGALSSSIAKWSGIIIPEGLGSQLESLADGVKAFTFGGLGASSIAEAASPLGTLADSVNKWVGITVPAELGTNLSTLAGGVKSFTFGGSGAGTIAEVASPLGTLADSVLKWVGITVPEDLGTNLKTLAGGVKSFTFGGSGAGTLIEVAGPLGTLADSVRKWIGLTVPEDLGTNLKTLAGGVKSFTLGGWGADTLIEVAAPLGTMADSVRKWIGLTVPEDLGTNLKTLAGGVKSFSSGDTGAGTIAEVAGPLGTMADSASKWSNITIPENLGANLKTLAGGIKAFSGVGDISAVAAGMGDIASNAKTLTTVNFTSVSTGTKKLVDAMKSLSSIDASSADSLASITKAVKSAASSISGSASKFTSAGTTLANALAIGLQSGYGTVTAAATALLNGVKLVVSSQSSAFTSAGKTLASNLANGIKSGKSKATSAGSTVASGAVSGAKSNRTGMYNAGVYLAEGLIEGINSKKADVYLAAFALGQLAVEGEKAGQNSASPSKETIKAGKWLGEGLVIGMKRIGSTVYRAGSSMGQQAVGSISKSISNVSDLISSDIDAQPTIRPVLDLSDVRSGANAISSMLGAKPSIGVMSNIGAISTMMNSRSQNGANVEVVSAIDKLRKDIANMPRESYSINGVTYDDGSNIKDFAQAVVRQARIGRRV